MEHTNFRVDYTNVKRRIAEYLLSYESSPALVCTDIVPDMSGKASLHFIGERFLTACDSAVRIGRFNPHYNMSTDEIAMCSPCFVKSSSVYYAILFHELIHWTGPRLGRVFGTCPFNKFDSNYCIEEMTAELGSLYLLQALNFVTFYENKHAGYVKYFYNNLPSADPLLRQSAVVKSFKQAEQAAMYLIEIVSRKREEYHELGDLLCNPVDSPYNIMNESYSN